MIPSMPWLWVVIPIDGADVCAHVCAVSVFVFVFVCVCLCLCLCLRMYMSMIYLFMRAVWACREK